MCQATNAIKNDPEGVFKQRSLSKYQSKISWAAQKVSNSRGIGTPFWSDKFDLYFYRLLIVTSSPFTIILASIIVYRCEMVVSRVPFILSVNLDVRVDTGTLDYA